MMAAKRLRTRTQRAAKGIFTIRLSRNLLIPLKQAGTAALALLRFRRYISPTFPGKNGFKNTMNGRQFIYHMQGLTKTFPPSKKVLDNIHLSFYPDAKIGVLGVNGSGKSTLLRIMAGIDKEFTGEGWVAEGARVGYLEQEPQLDPTKTVRENVMEGVAAKKALLDRYNEIASNYSDETADEMAKLQDKIDSQNLWDLDSQVDLAMDALRCPADDSDVTKLSGGERRRVALCRLLLDQPELLLLDEADQPSRRRERELARRPPAQLSGRDPDRDPRPLLPRQRDRVDP
jgi:ABC-type Mn2+/Zn2+ transport system ATPase subunit